MKRLVSLLVIAVLCFSVNSSFATQVTVWTEDMLREEIHRFVETKYHTDISDESKWQEQITYQSEAANNMSLSTNACRFVYISKDSGKKIFDLCIDQTGDWIEDNTLCVEKAIEEFKENVKYVYSGPKHWPAAVWAELGHFIQELPYYSNAGFAYHNAGYILPPSNALSVEEVNKTALEAIAIDGTAAHQQLNMCCKLNETIIWRTVIQIESDSDKNADNQSSIWMIEMDAFTGQILEKNEYHIGSDMPIYSYCVPWSIYCLSLE